ncbi:MAG: recombinase family protein [Synechococcaceae cyanobacterium]|nr:recombinase family protein [Synechococcaceae cyanobacterium]
MARLGYARCSTNQQDATRQLQALEAAGCEPVLLEHASGKTLDRPVLNEVLELLQPGDTLVIHELDRLGRSMTQMLVCVEALLERGVNVVTLDGKLNTEAMDPSITQLIVGVLGYAAEQERKAIAKRTREGREVAQAAGVKFGRKRTWNGGLTATVLELRAAGLGYNAIGTKLGITASKVRRILNDATGGKDGGMSRTPDPEAADPELVAA